MRKVFAGLAIALALAVVSQFYLAASGAFDTTPKDESFQTHRTLGYVIVLFALLLTGIAALARMPRRLIGMTGLVAGLGVAQALIRLLADWSTTARAPARVPVRSCSDCMRSTA